MSDLQADAASILTGAAQIAAEGLMAALEEAPTIEAGVRLLSLVRTCKRNLSLAEDELADWLVGVLGRGVTEVDRHGYVEVKNGGKRVRWDSEELVRRVVALALDERKVDPETGEYEREAEAVGRLLAECSSIANPSHSWRVTALRKHGLDPDEYSETVIGKPSIILHGTRPETANVEVSA